MCLARVAGYADTCHSVLHEFCSSARGAGVVVKDSTDVVFDTCTISDHGSMGVNITGGKACGVQNSDVAGEHE